MIGLLVSAILKMKRVLPTRVVVLVHPLVTLLIPSPNIAPVTTANGHFPWRSNQCHFQWLRSPDVERKFMNCYNLVFVDSLTNLIKQIQINQIYTKLILKVVCADPKQDPRLRPTLYYTCTIFVLYLYYTWYLTSKRTYSLVGEGTTLKLDPWG